MSELKPCPFCGGEAEIETESYFGIIVLCANCDIYSNDNEDEEEAKTKWNKRVYPWKTIEEEMPPMNTLIIANFNFMGKENSILRFGQIIKHDEEIIELEMKETFFEEARTGFAFDSEWIKKWMPIPE